MIHSFLGTGLRCPRCDHELDSDIDDATGTEILSCRCGHEEAVVQVKDTVEDWKRWCAQVKAKRGVGDSYQCRDAQLGGYPCCGNCHDMAALIASDGAA